MSNFFVILALLSIIAFIASMIKPSLTVFWSKNKTRVQGCLYLIAFLAFCIFAGLAGQSNEPKAAIATSSLSQSSKSVGKSAFNYVSSDLTPDNVKKAISSLSFYRNVTGVTVDSGTVTITVYDKDFLDEKGYIQLNQPNSADAFHATFQNKNVKTVIYHSDIPVTDSYGNQTKVTGQVNTMQRKDADKISNWDNFKYENMSQYYDVVKFSLPPESQVTGLHKAWAELYK